MNQDQINELLKEKKRAGARSLAKLGKDMRENQKRYFQTRSQDALTKSKKLEDQFDRAVDLILKT